MRVLNACFQNLNTGFSETRIRLLTFPPNAGPKCVFWKPEYGFCIKSKYSFLNNPNKGLKTLYKGFTKPAYGLWISPKYRFYKNSNTDFVKPKYGVFGPKCVCPKCGFCFVKMCVLKTRIWVLQNPYKGVLVPNAGWSQMRVLKPKIPLLMEEECSLVQEGLYRIESVLSGIENW